jgi:hypothetical protein
MSGLLTPQRRRQLAPKHPVLRREFCIPTPAIQRVSELALHAIFTGTPGFAIEAPPRFGKTTMSRYLSSKIREEACPLAATVLFNATHMGVCHSATRFYRELEFQSGIVEFKGSKPALVTERLRRSWWAHATEHEDNRLIFLCDEGQRLSESEFRWLADIFNYLNDQRVLVTCIFVCQPDINNRRNSFIAKGGTDLVFRFMPTVHSFCGVTSQQELEVVLSAYDDADQLEFPANSGVCYTQFFLPTAYSQGWRLQRQAEFLWTAFHPQGFRPDPRGIGMQWVSGAIQYALSSNLDRDTPQFDLKVDAWRDAVITTAYFDVYDFVRSGRTDYDG